MSKMQTAIFMILVLLGLATAGAYFTWRGIQPTASIEMDAATIALGKDLYQRTCASCHGAELQGQPDWTQRKPDGKLPAPPHDVTGHTWHHSDGDLFKIVKNGIQAFAGQDYKTDMPAYSGTLSDDQIRAVLAYIKSTWPEKQRKYQEQVTASGENPSGN